MNEASSEDGMGISYDDFLAQWNDDKEEFERQYRKHMLQEVIVDDPKDTNKYEDAISELSFDLDSDSGDPARLNFIQEKSLSIRKKLDFEAEPKSPVKPDDLIKVVLQEDTDTIPLVAEEEEEQ